jgi:CheY-like chemotaxis protein
MPDAAREHIVTVKQAGANLLSIINDILDFSKIEAGSLKLVEEKYLFSSLLNDVISIIRMRLVDSPIRFAVYIDRNIPSTLIGDELRLRQVLINVLGNAVKYTDKGFVSFSVCGKITDGGAVDLTLRVTDSGRGIKTEDIGRLFKEYVQVDLENNRGIEGVGLGLSITSNIVKAMGGDITVQSEYGEGSTFTVTLRQKIHSPEILASVNDPGRKNVLIYERREIYAGSIVQTLDNLGVANILVSNDVDLTNKLSERAYAFIFISFAQYVKNKDIIHKHGAGAEIVMLTEFGETIPDKELNSLAVPVHCISAANILNGASGRFTYSESQETARFTAPNGKVLIVDDINTNLKVAEGLLAPYKMQTDLRGSGFDAIEAVKSKDYDIVFMDHRMPGMDGIVAAAHIRAMGGEDEYYTNLPIVALTANAVAGTREMFMEKGFNDFISKPINTAKLNTILERWIPKEKQISSVLETGGGQDGDGALPFEIEGLDIRRGISISGGSPENYIETLATFYEDGLERIPLLKECLAAGDLALYGTYIHALKSAVAGVGGAALSKSAEILEGFADSGDLSAVTLRNDEFITTLDTLLRKIGKVVSAHGGSPDKDTALSAEDLSLWLIRLKSALDDVDAGSINSIIDKLGEMAEAENAADIRTIAGKIMLAEYDDAKELIDRLLGKHP